MNGRLVVRVSAVMDAQQTERLTVSLEEPPEGGDLLLDVSGTEAPLLGLSAVSASDDGVANAGRFVFDQLSRHPQIGAQLGTVGTDAGAARALYILLRGETLVEEIPWETLCAPNGAFLSLDPGARWPIGRMVQSDGGAGVRTFNPPLRVALLLSCLDIPAADEWERIWEPLSTAAFETRVLVLVSEEALAEQIGALADPRITLATVPSEVAELQARVSEFRPHIIHAFCHGERDGGPCLKLAVPSDWHAAGGPTRSLVLEPSQINLLSNPSEPAWLAVLNCCEVGAPTGTIHSMARDLVEDGPFAVTIAMREPVEPEDANTFSRWLYPGIIGSLGQVVGANGEPTVVDWASLTVAARRRLCENHQQGRTFSTSARSTREWTRPVLYVRRPQFQLRVDTGARMTTADALQLEALRAVLAEVARLPEDKRAAVRAKIAELEGASP